MILRSTLEKHLPVQDGEVQLSPRARDYVFHGSYIFPTDVYDVETTKPKLGAKNERNDRPFMHVVTRMGKRGLWMNRTGDKNWSRTYAEHASDIVDELNQPSALQRATRVEKIARRLKVATAVATLGLAATSLMPGSQQHSTSASRLYPAKFAVEGLLTESPQSPDGHEPSFVNPSALVAIPQL